MCQFILKSLGGALPFFFLGARVSSLSSFVLSLFCSGCRDPPLKEQNQFCFERSNGKQTNKREGRE